MLRLSSGAFAAIFLGLSGLTSAHGAIHSNAIRLLVDYVEGDPSGVGLEDSFYATFVATVPNSASFSGVLPGSFRKFDLTIGSVTWDETQVVGPALFLLEGGQLGGVFAAISPTVRSHPDLTLLLPASSGTWKVEDEPGLDGRPVYGGNFGGTYTIRAIPEPSGFAVWAILGLIGVALGAYQRSHRPYM